jgi:hypothetical protein
LQSLDISQDPAGALLSLIKEIQSVLALLQERLSTRMQGYS